MFESPLLQRMLAEAVHKAILAILKARFGTVPRGVTKLLQGILDDKKLTSLTVLAAKCPDLQAFREALLSWTRPRMVRVSISRRSRDRRGLRRGRLAGGW
jgi:hypothetical protein